MKKNRLALIGLALLLGACKEHTHPGYTVNGEIAGAPDMVYLTVFEGKQPKRIDSAEVVNGAFTFFGDRELPIYAAIETADGPLVRFFLENSPILISGSADAPELISVEGSPTTDLSKKYGNEADSIQNALFSDSLATGDKASIDSAERVIRDFARTFVKNNPGSVAAAYVLYRELSYDMPYDALYEAVAKFDPAVQQSVYLKMVGSMADALKKTAIGKEYADVSAPDSTGKVVKLSDVVGDGKYVLLDFWASWCPPCRAEAPDLVAAYKQYAPKGFDIYAVSLDKTKDAWVKGIKDLHLEGTHVSELKFWENAGAEIYGVRSIPSNILIGPDGKIIARNLKGEQLQQKLAELLGPATPAIRPGAAQPATPAKTE